jgi:hypothetical protein
MKIIEAFSHLEVPRDVANNTAVQDGVLRLREAIALAAGVHDLYAEAPDFLRQAVTGLNSWIEHARSR